MDRAKLNYGVDAVMGLAFLVSGVTGLVLFFFIPSGVRQGRYQEFLGMIKEAWQEEHVIAGLVIVILGIVHLILHWDWVVSMTKRSVGKSPS